MKDSIIVPVYNSSPMLNELVKRIEATMSNMNLNNDYELLLTNDASSIYYNFLKVD